MPGANPVASATFRIHGLNVIDSVLVVKLGELRNIKELREYPVPQSLRTFKKT